MAVADYMSSSPSAFAAYLASLFGQNGQAPADPSAALQGPPPPPSQSFGFGAVSAPQTTMTSADLPQQEAPAPTQAPAQPQSGLGGILGAIGSVAKIPLQVAQAYGSAYGALPQRLQLAAQQQQAQLQEAQDMAAQRSIGLQNARYLQTLLPNMSPADQLGLLTNPAELGKAYASRAAQHTLKPGDQDINGHLGADGGPYTAPQIINDNGRILSVTPNSVTNLGNTGPTFNADGLDTRGFAPQADFNKTATVPSQNYNSGGTYRPPVSPGEALSPAPATAPIAAAVGQSAVPPSMPTLATIASRFPGVGINSGLRTPARNAAVGGVPNSWHTVGTPEAPGAIDLAPPPGSSTSQLAASVSSAFPGTKVLNEGNHVHVQPVAKSPVGQSATGGGDGVADNGATGTATFSGTGPLWSAPAWNSKTNTFQQLNSATGEMREAGTGAFDPQKAKQSMAGSEQYTAYTSANDAWQAMINAASLNPGGMRAYALRDTFARVINPGAVARVGTIEAIKQAQGVPANVESYFSNLKGDGNVPPEIAQQILDVSHGFLAGHYNSAKAMNDSYAAEAQRNGVNPSDATVPMTTTLPGNAHLQLPPKAQLVNGDAYVTPKGLLTWNGRQFVR